MSDILRRIIDAQNQEDTPFYKLSDGKIMELSAEKGDVFTGYYQADDTTYYSEKDWISYQRQLELERLSEEEFRLEQTKLAAAREARAIKTKALQTLKKKETSTRNQLNTTNRSASKMPFIFGIISILMGCIAIGYFLWPRTTIKKENTTNLLVADTISIQPVNTTFGNAIITGSDVRMRAEPNLKGKIVTFFPKEGERVTLLQQATDSVNWAKVKRENGITGWVYGKYVLADTIQ